MPDGDSQGSLSVETEPIKQPTKVVVLFRQPCNSSGKWVGEHSTIGSTTATLYESPRSAVIVGEPNIERGLLEASNIGFRGMSGAVAISGAGKCVGMFVKRGDLISMKKVPEREFKPQLNFAQTFLWRIMGYDVLIQEIQGMRREMLTKNYLHELGVAFDVRRGIFIPSSFIARIHDIIAVDASEVVGKQAPRRLHN